MKRFTLKWMAGFLLIFYVSACVQGINAADELTVAASASGLPAPTKEHPATLQTKIQPQNTQSPIPIFPTSAPPPSATSSPTDLPGCSAPPQDYSLITINGFLLNTRTYKMLQHAQNLYGSELEITGFAITQGSYTDGESASFGTHSGGGAVDLSVMYSGTYTVAYKEIPPLIHALRIAGFAAWLRDFNDLYPGSPIHIHAIAIGDEHLSPAAVEQLTGKFGYFLGFSGIPQNNGMPQPDPHGGPLVCQWMLDLGYSTLDLGREYLK